MKRHILKSELSRAFGGWGFKLAVLLGLGIAVWQWAVRILPILMQGNLYEVYQNPEGDYGVPFPLWSTWLEGEAFSLPVTVYRLLLPILAALPFAASYAADARTGYLRQTVLRAGSAKVHASKALAVWLSGGVAAALPMVFSFLIAAACLPFRGPSRLGAYFGSLQLFGDGYAHTPLLFFGAWTLLIAAFAGGMALFGLLLSLAVQNRFFVLISPFVLYLFVNELGNMLDPVGAPAYMPMQFLHPLLGKSANAPIIFIELVLLIVLCGGGYILLARRRDTM